MGSRYNIVKAKGTAEQTPIQSAGSRYNINNRNETVGQRLNDSVKYTAASLGAGIAGVGEGISDILNAVASIGSGADYAKKAFAQNDVGNWMEGIRQETRPNAVVQFAGDVAQGIGQSSVFLLDAVVPFLGTGLFFSGITGQSIGNAVNETGDLSWREVGYGIASGAQEALVEKLIGAGGQAAGNLMSTATKGAVQKTIGKQAATSGARNILINVAKAAGGEFAEEFTEEFTDVGLKRLFRIDPEARITADTWKQALYSGAAGAVSGGLMASPTIVANYMGNERRGRAIVDSGRTEAVIRLARSSAETAGVSLDLGKRRRRTVRSRTRLTRRGPWETSCCPPSTRDWQERSVGKRPNSEISWRLTLKRGTVSRMSRRHLPGAWPCSVRSRQTYPSMTSTLR